MKTIKATKEFLRNAPNAYSFPIQQFAIFAPADLKELNRHVFESYSKKLETRYKSMTVKHHLTIIKVFLNHCVGEGWISLNTKYLKIPKVFARRVVCKWEEFEKMCSVLMIDDFFELQTLLILKFLGMGMRIGEITSLNIEDFCDIGMDKMYTIIKTEKSRRERIISWNEDTHRLILKYLPVRRAINTGYWMFCAMERGKRPSGRLTTRSVERRFEYVKEIANITSPITPHSVRHMAAHMALNGGADIKVIQLKLGHSNIQSTDNYLRLDPQESVKALEKHKLV